MQSVIQKKFYNSVKVFWIDKELLHHRIAEAVQNLINDCPEVEKVILFGSVADKTETPLSDVDILIVVKDSQCRFFDRGLPFKRYFQGFDLGSDIFVYTHQEIEKKDIPLVNNAFQKGKVLFERRQMNA